MSTRAFCPGHITGFFTIYDDSNDFKDIGSRGAGFCISLGASAAVEIDGEGWDIMVNGEKSSFLVVEKTLLNLGRGGTVTLDTDLPFSQGFGMSGACSLSAALAACEEVGLDHDEGLRAAHSAEVFCRTGLGDVIAQYEGGFEVRNKAGLPPHGEIVRSDLDQEVIVAVLGSPLITPDILSDVTIKGWIEAIGGELVDEFSVEDGFDDFIELSYRFASEARFLKRLHKNMLEKTGDHGKGSMSMIGNSVFLIGDIDRLMDIAEEETSPESVYLTEVDNEGARITE